MCLFPRKMIVFGNEEAINVPCGKCILCKMARAAEWRVRLILESYDWKDASFVTLTYSPEFVPPEGALRLRDLQLFLKRFRRRLEPLQIKYFACGEYGGKFGRPHYHLIIFGWYPNDGIKIERNLVRSPFLEACWPLGISSVGAVNPKTIRYVTDYMLLKNSQKKYPLGVKPFNKQSQGLGKKFALEHEEQIRRDLCVKINGKNVGLPRYFLKKLDDDGSISVARENHRKKKNERGHDEFRKRFQSGWQGDNDSLSYRQSVVRQKAHDAEAKQRLKKGAL